MIQQIPQLALIVYTFLTVFQQSFNSLYKAFQLSIWFKSILNSRYANSDDDDGIFKSDYQPTDQAHEMLSHLKTIFTLAKTSLNLEEKQFWGKEVTFHLSYSLLVGWQLYDKLFVPFNQGCLYTSCVAQCGSNIDILFSFLQMFSNSYTFIKFFPSNALFFFFSINWFSVQVLSLQTYKKVWSVL